MLQVVGCRDASAIDAFFKVRNRAIMTYERPSSITWEDVIDKDLDIHEKTEKEAIQIISQTANTVLKNPILKNKCVELIKKICTIIPDKYKQSAFVENIGSDGAYVIAKILKEKWRL